MKFGNFYEKVCESLRENHGWRGPVMYLASHTELLDILYEQYNLAAQRDKTALVDWETVIDETAEKIEHNY